MSGKSHSRRRTSGKTTSTGIAIVTDDLIAEVANAIGPGVQGPPGADGASAFEIAQSNGFNGTKEEWLGLLVGADGADGR